MTAGDPRVHRPVSRHFRTLAGGIGLLLGTPILLAWLAVRALSMLAHGEDAVASLPLRLPLARVLLMGPLLETALLMLAAAAVARALALRQPHASANVAICAGMVGLSFIGSHVLQSGVAALASLPMALLLSLGAACAVQQENQRAWARHGVVLFAIHVLYNAWLLALGGLLRV